MDILTFFKFWLYFGFSAATIFYSYQLIVDKKLKEQKETWRDFFINFLSMTATGPLGLFAIFFIFIEIAQYITDLIPISEKQANKLAPPLIYLFFFLLIAGIFTECTSPREGAHCRDGSYSYATGRGACSWHGGVSTWDKDYWWEDD